MFQAIATIATALNVPTRGDKLISKTRARLQRIETEVTKSNKTIQPRRPKVLSLEGLAPLCVGGNWLPDMKRAAGCVDALGDEGGCPARIVTWDLVLRSDPNVETTMQHFDRVGSAQNPSPSPLQQGAILSRFSNLCPSSPIPTALQEMVCWRKGALRASHLLSGVLEEGCIVSVVSSFVAAR